MRRGVLVAIVAVAVIVVGCGATALVTRGPSTPGSPGSASPGPNLTLRPRASLPPLATPSPAPSATATAPASSSAAPLPACAEGDVQATLQDPADWARTILDPTFRLDEGYTPPDLVPVSKAGIGGVGQVRAIALADLKAMHLAAKRVGVAFGITSAYRSYATQIKIFATLQREQGLAFALESAARPGHSEHQLGTAIDVKGGEVWLGKHAWEFGWVNSYPKQFSPATTCYKPEAWHFRYIGRAAAAAQHAAGVSLREWLWDTQP